MKMLLCWGCAALLAIVSPKWITADVVDWTAVSYSGASQHDFSNDQQTGNRDADIVGDANHAAFYTRFDDLGTASLSDGLWSTRVRIGSDRPRAGTFDNNLFVGVDGNLDGALDLIIGVHNQGSNSQLAIWDPGTGANTSPSSTSIVSPPVFTTAQTTTNYLFTAVTSSNDPTATNFDLDADGDTDFFLEFTMDFTDIVSSMNTVAGISIDETTQLSFILATANSDNSLNQDLNGADGGIGSALTWGELGVMSNPTSFRPVPEPASGLVVSLAMLSFVFRRRRVV